MSQKTFRKFRAPRTYNPERRTVSAVLATENPVDVYDFIGGGGQIGEILLMRGCRLPESKQLPLLDSHNQSSHRNILGSCRDLRIEGDKLVADLHFADDNGGQILEKQVRDGHLTDLSIGASLLEFENIPAGQSKEINGRLHRGPVRVVTRWQPMEASAVAVGADNKSTIRQKQRGENMDNDQTENRQDIDTHGFVDNTGGAAASIMAERQRVADIYEMCQIAGLDKFSQQFIQDGTSADTVRQKIFEYMKTHNKPIGAGAIATISDDRSPADAIADGLAMRAGAKIEKPAAGAEDFRHASLVDIARYTLSQSPEHRHTARTMSPAAVIREAMTKRTHTTDDYPNILANVGNKVLRNAYENHAATFEAWTSKGEGRDFKEMSRVQISEAPDLLEVGAGGEYLYGTFGESKEVFTIAKYGRLYRITWEAMVNDDVSAFSRIPRAFVASAKRGLNSAVYAILTANAAMSDGNSLFDSSNHGNLATGDDVGTLNTDNLSEARRAMRMQSGLNTTDPLNIEPKFLIVPAELETQADEVINTISGYDSEAGTGVTNPFYKKMTIITEPALDGTSTTGWYLAADPQRFDTIEVCYLDGIEIPYIEEKTGWNVDSWEFKIRFSYGVKALDWRGLYSNPGA